MLDNRQFLTSLTLGVIMHIPLRSIWRAELSLGTGKSVLLREIIKSLRKQYVRTLDAVAVTASTGI